MNLHTEGFVLINKTKTIYHICQVFITEKLWLCLHISVKKKKVPVLGKLFRCMKITDCYSKIQRDF